MTLSDIRPADSMPPVHDRGVVNGTVASDIHPVSRAQLDMMRAFFCYEFEVEQLDRNSLPAATVDAVEEWVEALAMSGLFAPTELRAMAQAWSRAPEALIRLLSGVDEVTARRGAADNDTDVSEVAAAALDTSAAYLRAS